MVWDETTRTENQGPQEGVSAPPAAELLLRELKNQSPVRAGLVGESPLLAGLLTRLRRLADSDVPVLIEGETGVGKERGARALHLNSERSAGPFVAESGATLRDPFFMRHLFGHNRGAFTGANASVPGLFDLADGGTLYIDEVSEVPPAAQACLLRVLETGEYWPLGAPRPRRSDFRLVTSTSNNLRSLVMAGVFRRDLFFRLRGAVVQIPALRERRSDILPAVEHTIREEAMRTSGPRASLTADARRVLVDYGWPGNLRELRNELKQAIALAGSSSITPALFQFLREPPPEENPTATRGSTCLRKKLSEVEAATIRDALRLAGGNKAEAARRLGLTRRTLYRRLENLSN